MIEYILNYLELKGQIIASAAEEAAVETGISLYLKENGIDSEEKREYFCKEDIITSIGNGKDTLGLMPTGGGKSITFQVPALISLYLQEKR